MTITTYYDAERNRQGRQRYTCDEHGLTSSYRGQLAHLRRTHKLDYSSAAYALDHAQAVKKPDPAHAPAPA